MATPHTDGFVGTIEAETRNVNRIWFSLTADGNGADWVKIGRSRAWFTMSLETPERAAHLVQVELLLAALRDELPVRVSHGGAAPVPSPARARLVRSQRRPHPARRTVFRVIA